MGAGCIVTKKAYLSWLTKKSMQKLFLSLTFGLLVLASAQAQTPFHELENHWVKIIVARDVPAMQEYLSDQLIYTHSNGVVENKTQYIENVSNGKWGYQSGVLSNVQVRAYGKTAVVHCDATMQIKGPDGNPLEIKIHVLHVYAKEKGKYRLVSHQATRF
jgi:ketosteroid isomerase-like protein